MTPTKDDITIASLEERFRTLPTRNQKVAGACISYLIWVVIAAATAWIFNIPLILMAALVAFSVIFAIDLYRIFVRYGRRA